MVTSETGARLTRQDVEALLLAQETIRNLPADKLELDQPFDALGLDSMDLITVIVDIEEQLDIDIAINDDVEMKTLGDVVDRIMKLVNERA